MRLTHESPRVRWLILLGVWTLVAFVAGWHALVMRDYVALLDRTGRRSPPAETPLRRPLPTNFMDAQAWVRHALALEEGAPWQVRFTDTDNAPAGRKVHWNSGFAHGIATAGRIEQARTGAPLPRATEDAMAWINLPLLLGCVVLFSAWVAQRAGAGAGVLVACGMLGSRDFYVGFTPNYIDHHGLLSAAVFGLVLGAVFMGGGWRRVRDVGGAELLPATREEARRAAVFSAICGAVGMWISAATMIPAVIIVGVAALAATWWGGRAGRASEAEFDPGLWRLWGGVGAGLSLVFYLLEYAPAHLGLRLEVNHPFYALAWWGGSELIALLGAGRPAAGDGGGALRRGLLAVAALSAAPLTLLTLGWKVFVAGDPFVVRLSESVGEGLSLLGAVRSYGWGQFFNHCNLQLAPLLPAVWLVARRRPPRECLLGFVGVAAILFVAMGCWQIRWWLSAGGPLLCLWLVVLAWLLRARSLRVRWLVVLAIAAVCYLPDAITRVRELGALVRRRAVHAADIVQPLYRDIAAALRASQPQGNIVLLTSPNASTGIGYYGRFQTLGTLFWENLAGLRAAAEIFSAPTDEAAFALLRARGVTHLALISDHNYLGEYFDLLHPAAPPDEVKNTFGYRLLAQRRLPQWVQVIPYRAPVDILIPDLTVLLLRIVPNQTASEAMWNIASAQAAMDEFALAEKNFDSVIDSAPSAERAALRLRAGNLCYQRGSHAAAGRFYRAALETGDDPASLRNLAWLLATSTDASVRNGPEALATLERLARLQPEDHVFANILAAALAENGRFPEAASAATRARELAQAAGEKNAEALIAQRLEAYRASRPWRQ